ncbi:MAG: hypothetical protein ACRDKV_08340 [Solirubrobacterales bacterium]
MTRFTVEVFASLAHGLEEEATRIRAAAAAVGPERVAVRYLSSILMPGDELCLHLFEGPSREAVRGAAVRAGLDPLRVIEAVTATGFEGVGS